MKKLSHKKWQLIIYDTVIYALSGAFLLILTGTPLSVTATVLLFLTDYICIELARIFGEIYDQIWRYGGIQCYLRLITMDGTAFVVCYLIMVFFMDERVMFARLLSIGTTNLLGALTMRMVYRYAYKFGNAATLQGRMLNRILKIFTFGAVNAEEDRNSSKVRVAILGAGRVGVSLAEELTGNAASFYEPVCFMDIQEEKIGRIIHGLPVIKEDETAIRKLHDLDVQEVILAVPNIESEERVRLYEMFSRNGYKVKVYDFAQTNQNENGRRQLREIDIDDLLFRRPVDMVNDKTKAYYKDKVILITGGGGSIGSELCRQIAKAQPSRIVVLDICENGAYDIRQELKLSHPALDVRIEIVSITDKAGLGRVFAAWHPEIVIHAAAHKHVPLMERNCIEAVRNNVFGTLNVVQCCEEYHAERFMMVSTDKAVNPTNVMGATKRMCEMIALCYSSFGHVRYSCTRFGNVLGSAGSVVPLFKRQIAAGGPVTVTDKRIIRYFMTIPEASQLVLTSGAIAKNGELFVLDMGKPVKILDLAESMIRLSGQYDIEIVETGLRPGEKLYEELLVKTEELDKTENELIYIERDKPLTKDELDRKLAVLEKACETNGDEEVRKALHEVVPTYKRPEEVNEAEK